MRPLGRIGIRAERSEPRMSLLTRDEQQTLMTMWSIGRSLLMFGGHLPDNDEFTLSLLNNDEALAVNQNATSSKQLFSRGSQIAWIAETKGSTARYLAVFNIGDKTAEEIKVNWSDLGLSGNCAIHDLWAKKEFGASVDGFTLAIPPHASGFYKLTPLKGK